MILIIKTGSTLPSLSARRGDFEDWIRAGMGASADEVSVVDVQAGEALPPAGRHAGVVITGSHSMVTERLDWSERTAEWLVRFMDSGRLLLGICYGHQLLSHALGGKVEDNPNGREYGTVEVRLEEAARKDELLAAFTPSLPVQASHTQAVIRLPPGAVHLASSARDVHHAYRVGSSAWGVQFHPEFDAEIMRAYIRNQSKALRAEGQDPDMLFSETRDTPFGSEILRRFAAMTRRLG